MCQVVFYRLSLGSHLRYIYPDFFRWRIWRYSLVLSYYISYSLSFNGYTGINRYLPGATNITTHQKVKRWQGRDNHYFGACLCDIDAFHSEVFAKWMGEFVLPKCFNNATSLLIPLVLFYRRRWARRSLATLANAIAKLFFPFLLFRHCPFF